MLPEVFIPFGTDIFNCVEISNDPHRRTCNHRTSQRPCYCISAACPSITHVSWKILLKEVWLAMHCISDLLTLSNSLRPARGHRQTVRRVFTFSVIFPSSSPHSYFFQNHYMLCQCNCRRRRHPFCPNNNNNHSAANPASPSLPPPSRGRMGREVSLTFKIIGVVRNAEPNHSLFRAYQS